jgi:Ca2+-transporting ATPase
MLALMLGYPPPFLAVQILWNNLVTEGVLTVNLVMDPPEGDEMSQAPIAANEPLISKLLGTRMFFMVPSMVASSLGWWIWRSSHGVPLEVVRTETFTLLAVCEWFNVLKCRSETKTALTFGVLKNHWIVGGLVLGNALQALVVYWAPLGRIFHTVPLDLKHVVLIGVVGSLVLWVEEIRKFFARRALDGVAVKRTAHR